MTELTKTEKLFSRKVDVSHNSFPKDIWDQLQARVVGEEKILVVVEFSNISSFKRVYLKKYMFPAPLLQEELYKTKKMLLMVGKKKLVSEIMRLSRRDEIASYNFYLH